MPQAHATSTVLPLLVLLVFTGCNWGYGAPVDRARVGSAVLHEDGERCVFSFHDVVYRPAEGLRAFPDGGIPRYEIDRHKIAVVNVTSGEVSVLVDEMNLDWLDGHGGFHIAGLRGDWALVGQGGQREDYAPDHIWWRLDLTSGELVQLALEQEFAKEGREVGRVELVDDEFTLIVVTKKGERPQEIWSRSKNGTRRHLATTDHFYGAANGEIWSYDVPSRAGARTNYNTGTTVLDRRANFSIPRKEAVRACSPRINTSELIFQEKVGEGWVERPLAIEREVRS